MSVLNYVGGPFAKATGVCIIGLEVAKAATSGEFNPYPIICGATLYGIGELNSYFAK